MTRSSASIGQFSLGFYVGNRKTGAVAVVNKTNGEVNIDQLGLTAESGLEQDLKPIFVGLTEHRDVLLLDPASKAIRIESAFPADAFPAHIYEDPTSERSWFMNDGDKQTGNDRLNCGDAGSSVTVIEHVDSARAKYLATICVGRGHHQAAFSHPSDSAPDVPRCAYISNLKDGTLSVIGNDPAEPDRYLKLIATINLCEPEREEGITEAAIPNNAFPHGLVYSPLSGKLYNLNNGYGDIAIIDPRSNEIEKRIPFKGHSNLFIAPGGRYIIGRGADRKSDPNHVIAKLSVLDVTDLTVADRLDLPDIYISKYYFNSDGAKLYLTTSSSGSPEQQQHLKQDALVVIDLSALPKLKLAKELRLGSPSGSLAFVSFGPGRELVFSSNSEDGSLAVIDGASDEIVEIIPVMAGQGHSRVWRLAT
jgi:DNA-binding beta-propeller fold protein YncE